MLKLNVNGTDRVVEDVDPATRCSGFCVTACLSAQYGCGIGQWRVHGAGRWKASVMCAVAAASWPVRRHTIEGAGRA
jgi:hypothetical protein